MHAPSLYIRPGIAVGVTGSAFLMTAITQAKAGGRPLLQRLTWWRVGPQRFAVAVLFDSAQRSVGRRALGSPDALRALTPAALLLYPATYISHFFFGPLFEEYVPVWFPIRHRRRPDWPGLVRGEHDSSVWVGRTQVPAHQAVEHEFAITTWQPGVCRRATASSLAWAYAGAARLSRTSSKKVRVGIRIAPVSRIAAAHSSSR